MEPLLHYKSVQLKKVSSLSKARPCYGAGSLLKGLALLSIIFSFHLTGAFLRTQKRFLFQDGRLRSHCKSSPPGLHLCVQQEIHQIHDLQGLKTKSRTFTGQELLRHPQKKVNIQEATDRKPRTVATFTGMCHRKSADNQNKQDLSPKSQRYEKKQQTLIKPKPFKNPRKPLKEPSEGTWISNHLKDRKHCSHQNENKDVSRRFS